MSTSIRWRPASALAGIILTACLVAGSAVPAQALTASATTWQGTGTVVPGISVTGTHTNNYTFVSTTITSTGVVDNAPAVLAPSACAWAGGSIAGETIAFAVGTGAWNCAAGALAGKNGSLVFLRVGGIELIVLTGGVIGPLGCVFQPDSVPPATITSYHLTCVGAQAGIVANA